MFLIIFWLLSDFGFDGVLVQQRGIFMALRKSAFFIFDQSWSCCWQFCWYFDWPIFERSVFRIFIPWKVGRVNIRWICLQATALTLRNNLNRGNSQSWNFHFRNLPVYNLNICQEDLGFKSKNLCSSCSTVVEQMSHDQKGAGWNPVGSWAFLFLCLRLPFSNESLNRSHMHEGATLLIFP